MNGTIHMTESIQIEPQLPFGDVNVVILTDVHSWVAGHGRQESALDADFGAILSFYEHLQDYSDQKGMNLFFVNNGDWAHGTGLTAPGDPSHFLPILEKMPWDALNCGNHELYENEKVAEMIKPGGFIDWFGDRYLTANILRADDGQPIGNHYKILEGPNNARVLTFGFLFNMQDSCDLIKVANVQEVVTSPWFLDVLKEQAFNAVLVLAHMDKDDPLVTVILQAMRDVVGPQFPIQFVTGHTHYRGETHLDQFSTSFEAGRYLDTVGFVSFPTQDGITARMEQSMNTENLFQSVFLDASVSNLSATLGIGDSELWTVSGAALNQFIEKTREKMGLTQEIGCAPRDYLRNVSFDDPGSLYGLYRDQVVPAMFFSQENTNIMFVPTESFRYDLLSRSELIVDDVWAVCPFNDTIILLGSFTGDDILKLNKTLNVDVNGSVISEYLFIGEIRDRKLVYNFYTHDFGHETITAELLKIDPNAPIDPAPTRFTSTLLWLSFVLEEWPCSGSVGKLPGWSPSPAEISSQHGGTGPGITKETFTVITIVLASLAFCALVTYFRGTVGYRSAGGHRAVASEESSTFKETCESNGANDVGDCGRFTDEDVCFSPDLTDDPELL